MPYLTNLATIARRTGLPVVEQPGWKTRGHGPMSAVRSVICHHDAAKHDPKTFNSAIQNGHSTLAGPLAHFALRRDGTIHVVAAGLAYHAGVVSSPETYGNAYSIGIEAGNNGVGEPWPDVQLRAYKALCAELCKAFGLPASRVQGHKEVASPRGRKPDPAGIDMTAFRRDVKSLMKTGGGGSTPSAPKISPARRYYNAHPEETTMELKPGTHSRYVVVPDGAREILIAPDVGEMAVRLQWHGPEYPKGTNTFPKDGLPTADWIADDYVNMNIHRMRPARVKVPSKAVGVRVHWTYRLPEGSTRDTYAGGLGWRF